MSKIKYRIILLGHPPHLLNVGKLLKWKSKLFEVLTPIDNFTITENSDGVAWDFSDEVISRQLPNRDSEEILLAITNVPMQENFFARRHPDNKICMTFRTIGDILYAENIPLENAVLRVLYSAALVYRRYGRRIPTMDEITGFAHDETRGCIFDMCGNINDVIFSTNSPHICPSCVEQLKNAHIETNLIESIQSELHKIRKKLYYRILDFIKVHPILALILSLVTGIIIGAVGSIIGSWAWEKIK